MWSFASEGVRGIPGVSHTKSGGRGGGGAIQGFETPIRILGNLKKILPLIGVRGGGNVFFITPERVRGMSKVFSTKRGSIQGFETPIRILAI